MGTIVITGSAGGIGSATRARLEADGHHVIGVDVVGAEVTADLSTPVGRAAAVAAVTDVVGAEAPGGALDGLVVAAGITGDDGAAVVSINHFGAVAVLEGLRPLLARSAAPGGGAAVAVSSNSISTQPGLPLAVTEACLAGDEARARDLAAPDGIGAYGASKLALARWVRRAAPSAAWIGTGVRLNAVAPGFIDTPMTTGGWDFVQAISDVYPVPVGRPGQAGEIAALLAFLLSPDAAFCCGSVLYADGGTDAALRGDDWPAAR